MKIIFLASEHLENDMPLLAVTKHVSWKIMHSDGAEDFLKLEMLPGDHNKYVQEIHVFGEIEFWNRFIPKLTFLEKLVVIDDDFPDLDLVSDRCKVYFKTTLPVELKSNKHKVAEITLSRIDYEYVHLEILNFNDVFFSGHNFEQINRFTEVDVSKFSRLLEINSNFSLKLNGTNTKIQKIKSPELSGNFSIPNLVSLSTKSINMTLLKKLDPYQLTIEKLVIDSEILNDKLVSLKINEMIDLSLFPNLTELDLSNATDFVDFNFPRNLSKISLSDVYARNLLESKDFTGFDSVEIFVNSGVDFSSLQDVRKIKIHNTSFLSCGIAVPKLNCEELYLCKWNSVAIGNYRFFTPRNGCTCKKEPLILDIEEKYKIQIEYYCFDFYSVNSNIRVETRYSVEAK